MHFGEEDEKTKNDFEVKSGSDDNYQTDDDFSDESFSDSLKRLKHISISKRQRSSNCKKNVKIRICRLNVPLRKVKYNHHFRVRTDSRKTLRKKTIKSPSGERKKYVENTTEDPKNGKRCRLGGKAKGKPEEELHDKSESDDDNDSYYFSRISLGYFQKFRDQSGASTSYEWHEECTNPFTCEAQDLQDKPSDEIELLELQRWGRTSLVYDLKSEASNKAENSIS